MCNCVRLPAGALLLCRAFLCVDRTRRSIDRSLTPFRRYRAGGDTIAACDTALATFLQQHIALTMSSAGQAHESASPLEVPRPPTAAELWEMLVFVQKQQAERNSAGKRTPCNEQDATYDSMQQQAARIAAIPLLTTERCCADSRYLISSHALRRTRTELVAHMQSAPAAQSALLATAAAIADLPSGPAGLEAEERGAEPPTDSPSKIRSLHALAERVAGVSSIPWGDRSPMSPAPTSSCEPSPEPVLAEGALGVGQAANQRGAQAPRPFSYASAVGSSTNRRKQADHE